MPVSDRRLIYSLLCLTPGNITITVVMICQCHLLYFSSFLAKRPLSPTPTSFCFPPASPLLLLPTHCVRRQNLVFGSQRNLSQRSHRLFLPLCFQEHWVPEPIIAGMMVALVKIKAFFTLLRLMVTFLELNGNSNKFLFCVFSLGFFPWHTPQCMGRCTQFFHCQPLFLQLQVITKVSPTTSVEERGQQVSVTKPLV